jgi:magnesium-transporting ATPase (P-type)
MSSGPFYRLRATEVYEALETSPDGLKNAEAAARLSLYGPNILTELPRRPTWQHVLLQGRHPFILIMFAAAAISLWQRDWTLTLVILAIAIVNALFSYWRERRAEQATDRLRALLPAHAHVIRDGTEAHVSSTDLVPGDVLILAEGDSIAADARVVEEYGLRTNNAALTGEAVAARKVADASVMTGISDLERPNLVFAGTSVANGTGRAVVHATGMLTQFGRIAHLTQSVQPEPSAFQTELERVSRVLTVIAVLVGAAVWALARFEPQASQHFANPLLLAFGTLVAILPESLPATLTLSLAMAVQRLAGQGVLAKHLPIVETLGNVSIICTDKSGTLTQNQMTVREVWVAGRRLQVTGVGYAPEGQFLPSPGGAPHEADLRDLLETALCCNNARLNPPSAEHPTWTSLGDQTEAALKVAAFKYGLTEEKTEQALPRVHEIPFDARRKRMTTIHRPGSEELAFVKGAPREILQLCTQIQMDGRTQPLDDATRNEIMAANDSYARRALRVLALARRPLPPRTGAYAAESVERELVFLGLMAMMDPPRPEVEAAVQTCHAAGIRTVMITGDYGLTAESMARRVGMITTASTRILTGAELDEMSDAALQELLPEEVVFARMAPEHKLRLVAAFQERGETVAVTGDGVNDAPALRKADVGISMGIVGTDVAKEAADVILTNDNFGSIVDAIREGRAVYDNIRKSITYIFSSNVAEVLPFLLTSAIGIPPALNVRQILAIEMGTDLLPALALGIDKPEPEIMARPPHRKNQALLDGGLLTRAFLWLGALEASLCYLAFLATYLFSGNAELLGLPWLQQVTWPRLFDVPGDVGAAARTVFMAGVIVAQVGNAFACRTARGRVSQMGWGSNPLLLGSAALALLTAAGLVYLEPLAPAFGNQSFPEIFWAVLLVIALSIYTVEWLRKTILRIARRADGPRA